MDFDFTTETITPDSTNILTIGGTGALELPSGTIVQQPVSAINGAIRWNTDNTNVEYYSGSAWTPFGTVTSVNLASGSGISVSGGPITTTGSITVTNTGVVSLAGTTNEVSVSGSSGAVTLSTPTTFIAPGSLQYTTNFGYSGGVINGTGSTQLDAAPILLTAITSTSNTPGGGVILPIASFLGEIHYINNRSGILMYIYPPVGYSIYPGAIDAPAYINDGASIGYRWDGINWVPFSEAIASGNSGISVNHYQGNVIISNTGVLSFAGGVTGLTPALSTTGDITLGGTLNIANGGTGQTSYAVGDILYASTTTALSKLADIATGNALLSGGVGVAPSWGKVGLTTHVSGTLGIGNGGTGQTTVSAAYNALSPMTTTGDIEYESAANTASRLAIGTSGQVLTVAAGIPSWATVGTASYSVNVGPLGSVAWTLVSGSTYTATITHNLGTQSVVVQAVDIATNQVIFPDLITITSTTQIAIRVSGTNSNLKTLRIVVIANGASIAAGASTPSSVIVQNNGVALAGTYTTINLTGVLSATNAGSGVANITDTAISLIAIRTLSYFATSLDSPNNSDWIINSLAATIADPTNGGLNVRRFSNTVEQGVGLCVPVPSTATNITITYKGRSASATAGTLQMRLYTRAIASATPAAVSAWSSAINLSSVSSPATTFYQTFSQTSTLSSLSLVSGNMYQLELTRNTSVGSNLAANWYMVELDIAFT